jgi:subtilisin family serine protease
MVAALAACSDETQLPIAPEASQAPLLAAGAAGRPIQDQYVVVLKKGVSPGGILKATGATPRYVYRSALNGFAAKLNAAQVAALRHNPNVESIEQDGVVTIDATQYYPTWGLDRIDQASRPLNSAYTYNRTGAGVNLYILDTGIRTSHTEFGGRATVGYDAIGDGYNGQDCRGHGTHVAGTAGGATYGVAKGVNLISVRVLDCYGSGTWSGVIAGVDWVTTNRTGPSVANMSLGGGAYSPLDQAVQNSINSGVTYVVSAGNSNANACNYSPARVSGAITVGATTSSDARASYSNYGSCLDLFAPGSGVVSAYNGSDTQTHTLDGTSMASPHVAGVAALYLEYNPGAAPGTVAYDVANSATYGKLSSIGSYSPNRLLYSGFIPAPTSPTNPQPQPTSPPSISVYCYDGSGYCEAYASGGTGGGYNVSWSGAYEQHDADGYSWASVDCYFSSGYIYVTASVTDSSGAQASSGAYYYCNNGGGLQPML